MREVPSPSPILCIAGPTASGKSALALQIARDHQAKGQTVELICVDSATIYRGMDIGTAKPSRQEQANVKHHLLDIKDPSEPYSAQDFAEDARRLIAEIQARGALPILVGGTMLYFKALMEPMHDLPKADPSIRATLDNKAAQAGWPAMHAELATIDPQTAARLSPNDSQRIQRALEVYLVSGMTLSEHFKNQQDTAPEARPALAFQMHALESLDRSALHERIAQRFKQMLEAGFMDEVRHLKLRGDLSLDLPSMRCVGYRQVWEHLDGAYGYDEMVERGIAATRQLAKRQLTWLRGWTACEKVSTKVTM